MLLFQIAMAVFVLTLLVWIGGAIARWRFKRNLPFAPRQRALWIASRIGVILQLAVVTGWLGLLTWFSKPLSLFHANFDTPMVLLYVLGMLAILGGIAIIAEAVWRIARGPGSWLARAGELLLGLCAVYSIWAIFACGLVNFNLHY
jgi:hypothetical protein